MFLFSVQMQQSAYITEFDVTFVCCIVSSSYSGQSINHCIGSFCFLNCKVEFNFHLLVHLAIIPYLYNVHFLDLGHLLYKLWDGLLTLPVCLFFSC